MKKTILLLAFLLCPYFVSCQTQNNSDFNLGFEKISSKDRLPDNWFKWGTEDFLLKADTIVKHSGAVSMLIEPSGPRLEGTFGCAAYLIPAI